MIKKTLMIAFPAILGTMMLLGAVSGASFNQEVFAANGGNEKVNICHNTSSEKNPQVTINVSEKAIPAHLSHGDFVGTCEDGPDCDHPTNAENPECVVEPSECEACQEAYLENTAICPLDDLDHHCWRGPLLSFVECAIEAEISDGEECPLP